MNAKSLLAIAFIAIAIAGAISECASRQAMAQLGEVNRDFDALNRLDPGPRAACNELRQASESLAQETTTALGAIIAASRVKGMLDRGCIRPEVATQKLDGLKALFGSRAEREYSEYWALRFLQIVLRLPDPRDQADRHFSFAGSGK